MLFFFKIIVTVREYFGIFSKLFFSSKLKTCDSLMGPKIGPIIAYFPSNAHFSASSKIGILNWKYCDLWVCILNRYFGSGLGSRHALIVFFVTFLGFCCLNYRDILITFKFLYPFFSSALVVLSFFYFFIDKFNVKHVYLFAHCPIAVWRYMLEFP